MYPPPPAKGGISVTNEDLHCLNDGEFLNDVILDFYLKWVPVQMFTTPGPPHVGAQVARHGGVGGGSAPPSSVLREDMCVGLRESTAGRSVTGRSLV